MHDAAVAAGLVRGEPVLLLEEGHLGVGAELEQPAGHRRADDPAADDGVALSGHHPPVVSRLRAPRTGSGLPEQAVTVWR